MLNDTEVLGNLDAFISIECLIGKEDSHKVVSIASYGLLMHNDTILNPFIGRGIGEEHAGDIVRVEVLYQERAPCSNAKMLASGHCCDDEV